MFHKVFLRHPRSIGESYPEHFSVAAGFGLRMIRGGIACVIHAMIPALFERTASETVKSLYATMKSRQPAYAGDPAKLPDLQWSEPQWQLEYEI